MKTSLYSRILTNSDADAALLDAWISERSAEDAISVASWAPGDFTMDARRLGEAADPYDDDVQSGQIRVLSPDFISGEDAFPYIAVLDRWMEDMWLVVPFSPYSFPATDGEMATGIPLVGQRVLQCWNARTAHAELVGKSYVMGMVDETVRYNAIALFRHAMSGAELPADFSALVGPPILSKADPRQEYLAESVARYAPLTEAARSLEARLAFVERCAAIGEKLAVRRASATGHFEACLRIPAYGTRSFALAAGDKPVQTTESFLIPAFGVELDVKRTPSEGKTRFVIYKGGERDAHALEGFVVADKDASPIGEIRDGVCVVPDTAVAAGFFLVDPASAEPVALDPAKREGE